MPVRKPLFITTKGWHREMADSDSLVLGGLSMSGAITMGGNKITGLADATAAGDALAFGQSGASLDGLSLSSDLAMGGNKITGLAAGTADTDAVNKSQLNTAQAGFDFKESVRVATVSALPAYARVANIITASANGALPAIDGISLAVGERLLLKDGAAAADNGIYVVTALGDASNPWVIERAEDANVDAEVTAGMFGFISEGTTLNGHQFLLTTPDPITLNTTGLTFEIFKTLKDLIAGAGLDLTNNTPSVNVGDGLAISADDVVVDLASNSGLGFDSGDLQVETVSTGAIEKTASGLQVKIDGTVETLEADVDGLKVKGVPALFLINDVAVGADVTAANLDTLTDGSNADALHVHAAGAATEAPKVENTFDADEALAIADPVYFTATGDRLGKSDAGDEDKSEVIAIARTAAAAAGDDFEAVTAGPAASVLSGATAGTVYYLQSGGGIGTTLPSASGDRLIQVGVAMNATDLWVKIVDYGQIA